MKIKDEMVWLLLGLMVFASALFKADEAFSEDRIKVGILDSGISKTQAKSKVLCKDGLKTALIGDSGLDNHGHGANIFSIISYRLNPNKYCIVSYKIWDPEMHGRSTVDPLTKALRKSIDFGVKVLNVSIAGPGFDRQEYTMFKKAAKIMKINIAAGNDSQLLGEDCNVYPACYRKLIKKNIQIIGGLDTKQSNYGKYVDFYTYGKDIGKPMLTGTSQATALFTNLFLRKTNKNMVYKNRSLHVRPNFFGITEY